jgi:hypothetical protein
MLRRIKQIPGIRFYHVVPVDHLTARLSEEKRLHQGNPRNAVAKELTALMLNSYFPQGPNVSGADQLQRTLTFLLTDSSAALVFYANLVDHLEVESITKFIVMMLACLKSAVDVDQAQQVTEQSQANSKKRRRRGASIENDDTTENNNKNLMSASNTSLMAGLSETICVLWESIEPILSAADDNQPSKDLLTKIFAEAHLVNLLSHFDQKASEMADGQSDDQTTTSSREDCFRVCAALLRCAALLPRDTVDGIVAFISTSLSSLSKNDESCHHVSSHLALLCQWGMVDELASSLAALIESSLGDDTINLLSPCFDDGPRRSRRFSSDGRMPTTTPTPTLTGIPNNVPPEVAWEMLDDILKGSDPSSVEIREAMLSSESACRSIESALERGTFFAERLLIADSVSVDDVRMISYGIGKDSHTRYLATHKGDFWEGIQRVRG